MKVRVVNTESIDRDYVFISYSHNDKKYVMEDMNKLTQNGVVFWYDDGLEGGDDWEKKVNEIINRPHCKGMIFYVSKNFLQSKAILREIDFLNKKVKRNPNFKYIPIFITIESVYHTLKEIDIEEKDFITLLKTFPSSLIHHRKTFNNFTHIEKLIDELNKLGVVQSKFSYDGRTYFKTKKHVVKNVSGLKIVGYDGLEKNLLIPSYLNGEKVISIGHDCFRGNDNVENIVLPEGIIEICDMAFKECSSLKYISIPATLVHVGYEAFRECTLLESIIFSTNVKYIGDYCFYKCHSLKNVIFNANDKVKLGYGAFSECLSLKEIKLPEKISELGSYCFNSCDSLESLTLPLTIDSVGDYIFLNCVGLTLLYISTDKFFETKNIFENCVNLKQIIFSTANYKVFYDSTQWHNFSNLPSVQLYVKLFSPTNLEIKDQEICWDGVFGSDVVYEVSIKRSTSDSDSIQVTNNCYLNYSFTENNTYYISVKALSSTNAYLPSDSSEQLKYDYKLNQFDINYETKTLVRYNGNGEELIRIPDDIKIIGKNAFEEACDIEKIVLGEQVKTIEEEAFIRCRNLKEVKFNKQLEEIKSSAFAYCTNLEKIVFEEGLSKLGESSFACCDELREVDFTKSHIKEIPKRCFYRCIKLNMIDWNNTLTAFKDSAFRGCSVCEFKTLPPNLETIGNTVFSFNTSFKIVNLPSSIKNLANDFLWYTINVEEVSILNSTRFFTEEGVLFDTLGTLIYYPVNSKMRDYTTPKVCHNISPTSFTDCAFLEEVNLEEVEVIENNNFDKCKMLNKVVLNRIKSIGNGCFNNCKALKEIIFNGDQVPFVGEDCFLNCNEELSLIMNKNLLCQIKKDKRWQKLRKNLAREQCSVKLVEKKFIT